MSSVAFAGRTGEWLESPGFGAYVHIPFCRHRCHYCDFNTYSGLEDQYEVYVEALVADILRWEGPAPMASSVFFGGGTPTLLPVGSLARILAAVRDRFGCAPDAEVTIEANPEGTGEKVFAGLLDAGFNRVSFGIQSLVPSVLTGLGRMHSPATALRAIAAARAAGFDDVNADLIYGSPWESTSDWRVSLEGIVEAEPNHVSAYALTIEEGTPLATLVATGRVPDVDPDLQADRHGTAEELLGAAGLERYEISNWARPGRACRHNVLYWSAGDYAGFGAGAHGHVAGRRSWRRRLPRDFVAGVDAGTSTEAGAEVLDADARCGEAFMLGLRLASGLDLAGVGRRYGAEALETRMPAVEELTSRGLMEWEGSRLRIAPSATMVAGDICARLL
ncbi:MAG: radical SAM family heme chaperone HemW [Actinomycetota bacterium]|nr:radical SAM family heme chaperone HemW [Actinomycetota bacterium]